MCKSLDRVYNRFFYATVCHVCKQYGERIALKMCSGCRLIYYCSRDHQRLHWPQHRDLCRAVQHVRKTCPSEFTPSQEKKATTQLARLKMKVALRLERKLLPYEVQMFKYARMCLVCQKQNCHLEDCPACMSVSFCTSHTDTHDKKICSFLKQIFTAYLSLPPTFEPVCVDYMHHISEEREFSNMKKFLSTYGDIINTSLKLPKLFVIEQSTNFTDPLTVIQGMRVLDCTSQKKSSLVFHVIAGNTTEMWCLPCWEVILHLVPNIRYLKLVLIGPEQVTYRYKLKLCSNCRQDKKKLPIEWLDKLYEDYVEDATFTKPDLIIGFHLGLYRCNTERNEGTKWVPSIQTLAKQKCPLVLTYYSEVEAKLDIENINSTLGKSISYHYCEKNPFRGYRPYRESENELQFPFYFKNYYLVVYKSLCL